MTSDTQLIDTLRSIPGLIPVIRDYYETWSIRVFSRQQQACRNYLSPNRRDYYKVLFISEGSGVFTLGTQRYDITGPTVLFLAPSTITSWSNLSAEGAGYYCLFKHQLLQNQPTLKASVARYGLFSDPARQVMQVSATSAQTLGHLFRQMETETQTGDTVSEEVMAGYLQVLLLECVRTAEYHRAASVTKEYGQLHAFFELLEAQAMLVNYAQPLKLRTAKEFAAALGTHPNHLNALLKKHTGQPVSAHIRGRLLEEAKALLLQTTWSVQEIGHSLGFAERANFSLFFKQHTGVTPVAFRLNPNR